MEQLTDFGQAESKVLCDVLEFLDSLRKLPGNIDSLDSGISLLRELRASLYESLNQIQHGYLILQALRWLRGQGFGGEKPTWYWNPRQTGDASEPDLMARDGTSVLLCAEVTTSEKPSGTIDTRMRETLEKLSRMEGRKFYIVRTQEMARRARTKVNAGSWNIEIVQI